MSFLAKLKIDDKEYNVVNFSFGVQQEYNIISQYPSGSPNLTPLIIELESSTNSGFFHWSVGDTKKDGKIVFYKRDAMASSRTLEFTGAHLVGYNESFNASNANPMMTVLKLIVEELKLDDGYYENPNFSTLRK